jgi:hypothetical protein
MFSFTEPDILTVSQNAFMVTVKITHLKKSIYGDGNSNHFLKSIEVCLGGYFQRRTSYETHFC